MKLNVYLLFLHFWFTYCSCITLFCFWLSVSNMTLNLGCCFDKSQIIFSIFRRPSLDVLKRPGSQPASNDPLLNPPGHLADPQAQKRAQFKEGPKFGLKSMVSMEDMPELFASFDSKYYF